MSERQPLYPARLVTRREAAADAIAILEGGSIPRSGQTVAQLYAQEAYERAGYKYPEAIELIRRETAEEPEPFE